MQLWVIHNAMHNTCTCLDCCFIFPSAMRAFWNARLTEIDPVVPTHCCSLLFILQLPTIPSFSVFFLCVFVCFFLSSVSVAEPERCLASLLLSSLIAYLHSFSLRQHQMKEAPSSAHCLCMRLFVSCWLQIQKVEVFCTGTHTLHFLLVPCFNYGW